MAQEPAFARAHDNLGLCYEALHQPDEAVWHYREAVRLNREVEHKASPWPRSIWGSCSARAATSKKPSACFGSH